MEKQVVVVDLAGVKTTLDIIPDGTYPARYTAVKAGKSKNNNDKFDLEFVLNTDDDEINGRKAFVQVTVTENSLWRVKKTLVDLGYDPSALEGKVNLNEAFEELLGADAVIKVGHHEYNN